MEVVSLKSDTAIFCCFVKKAKNCLLLNRNSVLGISIYPRTWENWHRYCINLWFWVSFSFKMYRFLLLMYSKALFVKIIVPHEK